MWWSGAEHADTCEIRYAEAKYRDRSESLTQRSDPPVAPPHSTVSVTLTTLCM